jgi:hypothetical protein
VGAQTPFVPDDRAYYGLIDRGSGRCLDIARASAASGAAAVQWEFTHAASQQWRFVPMRAGSEYYRIEARHSGQCLTVDKAGENVALVQRPFQGSEQQQWRLVAGRPRRQLPARKPQPKDAAPPWPTPTSSTARRCWRRSPANRASQQWRLFRLRLNLAAGGETFGPPAPLASVSSAGNELSPVLAPDGQTMYLARTKFAGNTEGNTDSGDAWVSQLRRPGPDLERRHPPRRREHPQNNGVVALTGREGQTLIVRGTYERDGSFRDEGLSRVARSRRRQRHHPQNPAGRALRIANLYSASPATGFFMTADGKIAAALAGARRLRGRQRPLRE